MATSKGSLEGTPPLDVDPLKQEPRPDDRKKPTEQQAGDDAVRAAQKKLEAANVKEQPSAKLDAFAREMEKPRQLNEQQELAFENVAVLQDALRAFEKNPIELLSMYNFNGVIVPPWGGG